MRLLGCDVGKVFKVRKCIQVSDLLFHNIELIMLSGFNKSGWAENSKILLVWNIKVFRIKEFDMVKSPAV
jgi:hypothetical protein